MRAATVPGRSVLAPAGSHRCCSEEQDREKDGEEWPGGRAGERTYPRVQAAVIETIRITAPERVPRPVGDGSGPGADGGVGHASLGPGPGALGEVAGVVAVVLVPEPGVGAGLLFDEP